MSRYVALSAACVLLIAACPAGAVQVEWNAATGVLPDSTCPAWTFGSSGGTPPHISGGQLTISTAACTQNLYYLQQDPDLVIPDSLVVEARLRFDSGSECVGPCGHYRQAAAITITTAPHKGVLCFVGPNEMMLVDAECAAAHVASVATQDAAHTYKIVVRHGTDVAFFYDGVPMLSGTTYESASDHAESPRILWGEGSSLAYGSTRWEFVRHNAHATGCVPTAIGGPGEIAPQAPMASPNPFRAMTSLRFTASRAGRSSIAIVDIAGRVRRRLVDDASRPGPRTVQWDGADEQGRPVEPGVYRYIVSGRGRAQPGVTIKVR